jgi:hypothetical protein
MCSLSKPTGKSRRKKARLPVAEIIDKLDQAVSQELSRPIAAAASNEPAAQAEPTPDESLMADPRQAAISCIRQFRETPTLTVDFVTVALNPYAHDGRTMDIYEDDQRFEYWLEKPYDRLIQAAPAAHQPAPTHKVRPENRLPVSELRQLAYRLIAREVPDFDDRRSQLHPLEDNRQRRIYFFRFDDFGEPVPESELPPFVQVGLRADGQLVSFTNTLTGMAATRPLPH